MLHISFYMKSPSKSTYVWLLKYFFLHFTFSGILSFSSIYRNPLPNGAHSTISLTLFRTFLCMLFLCVSVFIEIVCHLHVTHSNIRSNWAIFKAYLNQIIMERNIFYLTKLITKTRRQPLSICTIRLYGHHIGKMVIPLHELLSIRETYSSLLMYYMNMEHPLQG